LEQQTTTAEVLQELIKIGAKVVSHGRHVTFPGFDRPLLAATTICRCSRRSKARSWPRNRWNLANVG
jgi:hypothetical protein